ncbi:MAG: sigma 54-interacting transcriptional regulator [Planctomycetota bacterium]
MTEPTLPFDDRESFVVAQAVVGVIRDRCAKYADDEAVWEAFASRRGRGDAEYIRQIRSGGKYIFYALLQDLFEFAEAECGESMTVAVGARLTEEIARRHLPDLLQATMFRAGTLSAQILWIMKQLLSGTTGDIYKVTPDTRLDENLLSMTVEYRLKDEMAEYLKKTGHNPARAFANSFGAIHGVVLSILQIILYGFEAKNLHTELSELKGTFLLSFPEGSRFHYEQFIEILLGYVKKLHQRKQRTEEPLTAEGALCASPAMRPVWERILKASTSNETVVLCGESGTGKSYFARLIHQLSGRYNGPFVEVGLTSEVGSENMIQSNLFGHVRGAFTGADDEKHGLFALADDGTIFLDEIGDASAELQAKLLRVLEMKNFKMLGGLDDIEVDVRIITATNKDLAATVEAGSFREDLYYRLNVIRIDLPPLRERTDDIPSLLQRLLDKVSRDAKKEGKCLTESTVQCLIRYPWPGNIRQMENALRHAVALSEKPEIEVADLPPEIAKAIAEAQPSGGALACGKAALDTRAIRGALTSPPPAEDTPSYRWPGHVNHVKREFLKILLEHHRGNLTRMTGHWDRSSEHTLLKQIREFGLEEDLQEVRKRPKA